MVNDCTMLEGLGCGIGGEDDQVELSLGLSIGGNFRDTAKPHSKERKTAIFREKIDSESDEIGAGLGEKCVDPERKYETKAKPREGERRKSGDEAAALEAQRLQIRVRDREMRENEANDVTDEDCVVDEYVEGLSLTLSRKSAAADRKRNRCSAPLVPPPTADSCPRPAAGHFCPAFQYFPFVNGFWYPNMVPGGRVPGLGDVIRPAVCRSFQPYHKCNDDANGGNGNAASSGSTGRSYSDNWSKSQQGGSSSDTGSRSSHSQQENQQNASAARDIQEQSEHSSYCSQTEPVQVTDKATKFPEKMVSPRISPPSGMNPDNPSCGPLKPKNGDIGKPPKPRTGNKDSAPMTQMPCVSTTRNGPDGKTVTGFLYRYTKTEVSIICVCHGSSFSPAEFVKHAGGNDVSHPLRHITVIPPVLG